MSEASTIRSTVLAEAHARLGATFTDFGGWRMPVRYSSDLAEHRAVRTAAGLFDLSHMGEVRVEGPQAGAALDRALVGRLSRVAVGRARYSLLCDDDGGILDDLITYRLSEDRFLVVPNAANTATAVAALTERAAGFDAEVTDVSPETSLLGGAGTCRRRDRDVTGARRAAGGRHRPALLRRRPRGGGRGRGARGAHRLHR